MMTALFIGMVTGITVWWLLIQRLKDKPWTERGVIAASQDEFTSSAPKVGLWVFLAMVTSFFLIFNSAYLMRMGSGHGELASWVPLDEPAVLWLNTAVLVLASVAMQMARNLANKDDLRGLRTYHTAGLALSLAFLCGQVLAWQQLASTGDYGPGHPAFTFFILLTAVHGLHLLGGMWVAGRTNLRVWRGLEGASVAEVASVRQSVQLCTTYWHFLLIVWVALFAQLSFT